MSAQRAKIWLQAFRLRTLPLAVASIMLGSFLAAAVGRFQLRVALLCAATALLLQILSNLANDYGDTMHGADSRYRVGPQRVTQSGAVSRAAMRMALLVLTLLCLVVGYILIRGEHFIYHVLGLAAVAAAIAYTAGPKPYGYAGLGDLFVFVFFGLIGVGGTYYLHTHILNWYIVLPAAACGFFCVAVLNINNIRDMHSDRMAGKFTIPVRLGARHAKVYHACLLLAGSGCAVLTVLIDFRSNWQLLFLISLPPLLKNAVNIGRLPPPALDPCLKQMAMTTLLFTFSFGLGMVL
jgi:1,4-dihydroxy-2-naphthoate octaprenyltransferase